MIGLFVLFVERKMVPPTPEEFLWFYTLKANKSNLGFFFYFAKKMAKGVQVVTKIKESLGNWKDDFFFTPKVWVRGHFGFLSKFFQ